MTINPELVQAWRGGVVESAHRGALAVVDADGATVLALGDVQRPIFPRSAVKILQALPLVESGAAERFSLSDAELALACASHNGEELHATTAASMLAKAGLNASALECGAHWPYQDAAIKALARRGEEPSALHNNCSGKHAGFVCLACVLASEADRPAAARGYVSPRHPAMKEVAAALQATTGWDLEKTATGVDGCSIPTYAIPLHNLAHAFAKVSSGVGLSPGHARAAKRLRQAVAKEPFMVAGTGRFDTRVMAHFGERVFCKVGAEGVYCAALPEQGWGVALKMDDGNNARACEVVMAALIERLLPLQDADAPFMRSFSDVPLHNWNGTLVGRLAAAPLLRGC